MKLLLCFATLMVTVNASSRQARDVRPGFTCGPQGIRHHTNETIGLAPTVKMTCSKVPVTMDARTEIECEVTSSTFAKIAWFYNGRPLSDGDPYKSHLTVDGKSCNQTLKINFAKTRDSGNYTCHVANTNGSTTKTCLLEVKADKYKAVHIEYLKIDGGRKKAFLQGRVNLACNMLNVDVTMWQKNGSLILSKRHLWKREHTFGQRGMMFYLEIVNVTKNDEGLYMCIGQKNGIQANKTFYLETEPCPPGYYCPHDGNKAIPCPRGAHGSNSVPRGEVEDCSEETPGIASVTDSGLSSHKPESILLFMFTFIAIYEA